MLSLFDGISCGMVALERAEIPVERYVAYEIDKYAIKVSEKNYPQIERCGDVFDGDFTEYKGFDLLIGGSPCQHWSIVNKVRETNPDGIGGQLFMQYVRALKDSECKCFLYENVYSMPKNIKTFITEQLRVEPIMINSALVSAQQRRRLYWTNIPNVKQPEDKMIGFSDIIDYSDKRVINENRLRWLKSPSGESALKKHRAAINPEKAICITARSDGSWNSNYVENNGTIRPISPFEAERLQTLPDNYTAGISNTQRYKCIGNGWTVDVIAHILRQVKED